MTNYINSDKKIFDLQQRHAIESYTLSSNKNFFSSYIVNIFTFTSSIISIITIILVVYLFCKHKHIIAIVSSLILHKIKEVEANSNPDPEINRYECRTLAYVGIILTVLSMIIVISLHYRKSRLCRGYRFSNVVKMVLFISDVQNYILIKLCKTSGSIHLFKIKGTMKSKDIKLNKNHLWDTLEINWNKIIITFNGNKIALPKIVTIKMQDKIGVRRMINFSQNATSCMVFFRCKLPVEVVDVEVKITSMQGTHIFRRDGTMQLIKCTPWNTRFCPHPTVIKKM